MFSFGEKESGQRGRKKMGSSASNPLMACCCPEDEETRALREEEMRCVGSEGEREREREREKEREHSRWRRAITYFDASVAPLRVLRPSQILPLKTPKSSLIQLYPTPLAPLTSRDNNRHTQQARGGRGEGAGRNRRRAATEAVRAERAR